MSAAGASCLVAADAENFDLARAERRQRKADADRHQIDMSGNDIGERRRGAAIVNSLKLHAGHALEQDHVHVRRGPDTGGAIGELARLLLRQGDQLAHVVRRQRRMAEQRLVDAHDTGDWGEVLLLVIGQLAFAVEDRIDREGAGFRHQQRIAVGRGFGHRLRAQDVGGAALVFDHDLLAPRLREPLADARAPPRRSRRRPRRSP